MKRKKKKIAKKVSRAQMKIIHDQALLVIKKLEATWKFEKTTESTNESIRVTFKKGYLLYDKPYFICKNWKDISEQLSGYFLSDCVRI